MGVIPGPRLTAVCAALLTAIALSACQGAPRQPSVAPTASAPPLGSPSASAVAASPSGDTDDASVRAFAVGDLGNKGERDELIASVIERHDPDAFLALGDTVYPNASADNYAEFYDSSYGRLNDIAWPVPGNHDYRDDNIGAYLDYFDAHAPNFPRATYYAFELGSWRFYALDSEIDESDPGDDMYEWLRQELTANPSDCMAAMWHSPVYTAGSKEYDEEGMRPIYDLLLEHGVDLVLTGHDHNYQRWDVDGIGYFVVGTGGKSRYELRMPTDGLAYGNDEENGALQLDLDERGARYVFRTMNDEVLDPGSLGC